MSSLTLEKPKRAFAPVDLVPLVPPPLQSGDHLTGAEFERRYDAMPGVKKAELIDGMVFLGSPVSSFHAEAHAAMMAWLKLYSAGTPGTKAGDNVTVRLDARNQVQPDAYLAVKPLFGGQTRLSKEGFLEGGPELIVEIAVTSADKDLHEKFELYRRHRVREYLVWQVLDSEFRWFVISGSRYVPLQPKTDGVWQSRGFPGLWLDAKALLNDDFAAVEKTLRAGMSSKEHADFVTRTATRK